MTLRYLPVALLLCVAPAAAAQTPLLPGQLISLEMNPGVRQPSPTSPNTVPRPEANVVFEYRIDNAATSVPAVKSGACTPVTVGSPTLTCRLLPPSLTSGAHVIEVRALVSPAEAGVPASDWSTPLSVAMVLITGPSVPSNVRVTSQPQP